MTSAQGVQDIHAPHGICFGCGPANDKGLRIKSNWQADADSPAVGKMAAQRFIARFTPEQHHQAFPNVLNGGIVGALMDCHSNWCAVTALMAEQGLDEAPSCVTADFHVKLRRPCPTNIELTVRAWPVEIAGDKVIVEADITTPDGKVQATCRGTFVAVPEGHPAYHRWN